MSTTVTPRPTGSPGGMPLVACSVVALGLIIVACTTELTNGLTPPPRTPPVTGPAEIRPFSGNDQAGPVGTLLPLPVVARVYDSTGIPVPGVPVSWTVNKGGELTPEAAVTDSDGNAIAGWTLGDTAGPQKAIASSPVGDVLFTSNALRVLARISLSPSLVTLNLGASQQFSVIGIFTDGTTGSVPVTYSTVPITCGNITSGGLFVAGDNTGTCKVIATQVGGARLADTAIVNIVSLVDTLSQITLSPRKASVPIGGSLQYSVTGTMSDGSTIVPSVSYSVTGGTIGSSSGVYTPPGTMGTFKVTATQVGGTIKDTTSVFVVAALVQDTTEPAFTAGVDQMLWSDNFDRYYSPQDMQWSISQCGNTLPDGHPASNYGKHSQPNANNACSTVGSQFALIPGRGGAGQALRGSIHADPNHSQQSVTWLSPWTPNGLSYSGRAVVIQFWFRASAGGTPGSYGTKWVEAWFSRGGAQRIQWGMDRGSNTRPLWAVALGSNPGGTVNRTTQPIGPWWDQLNDGQWHRATQLLVLNTSSTYSHSGGTSSASETYSGTSSRDGRVALWIDGTKVMDYSQATVGVTPPGGTGVWCRQGDVDMIPGQTGSNSAGNITYIKFPDVFNGSPVAWTLDHDDLAIWEPAP